LEIVMSKTRSIPSDSTLPSEQTPVPRGLQHPLLLAVRLSATRQGATATCRRQSCRLNGRCRARLDTAGTPDCKAELNAATGNDVVGMLLFAFLLARSKPGSKGSIAF
jgi:hypothetical protein